MSGFRWRRQRGSEDLDDLLLKHRPEPKPDFLRAFSNRFHEEGARATRRRLLIPRLAYSVVLTSFVVAGLALSGGFQSAASGAVGAYQAVKDAVAGGATTTSTASDSPSSQQYFGNRCGQNPPKKPPKPDRKCPLASLHGQGAEGNSGTTTLLMPVVIADNLIPDAPASVSYATSNGTAKAGSDYIATSGRLTFDVGQTLKLVPVQVIGDRLSEPNETFYVNLSNPSPMAEIAVTPGVGTILNND